MYIIELLIKLKIEDVTAVTAKRTLTKDMGYAGILESLSREDYWKMEVEAESLEEAGNLGRELAEKRKIFVNPNKHTCTIAANNESMAEDEQVSVLRKKEGVIEKGLREVKALVKYRQDEGAILAAETLRNTLGYGNVIKGVERGVLWTLLLRAGKKGEARELAREIVLTRNMDKGLLANPHSQDYEIFT